MSRPSPSEPQPRRLVSLSEVAQQLGISRSSLYVMRDRGEIVFGRLLGKRVIAQDELDRIVAEQGGRK